MSEEKKNCQLHFRLTSSELKKLQKNAKQAHMSISSYIIHV